MRSVTRIGLALWLAVSSVATLPAAAEEGEVGPSPINTTSTEGVHIMTVPGTFLGTATEVGNNNWVAINDHTFTDLVGGQFVFVDGGLIWMGTGSPIGVGIDFQAADPQAFTQFRINDLNDLGVAVGSFVDPPGPFNNNFRWSESTGFVDLGPRGDTSSKISGIDNAGNIAGHFTDLSPHDICGAINCSFFNTDTITEQAFTAQDVEEGLVVGQYTFTEAGGVQVLGDGTGIGLATNGNMIVGARQTTGGTVEAVVWTSPASGHVSIGTLPGHSWSTAYGVNGAGQVVGWSDTSQQPSANRTAFVWNQSSGIQSLGTLPTGGPSTAWDINDNGLVAGEAGGRAVIWDLDNDFNINYPPTADGSSLYTPGAEGDLLVIQPSITDPEGDPYLASFEDLPTGASWDPGAGTIAWQTQPGDGGFHQFKIILTEDGNDQNSSFAIGIFGVQAAPPVIDDILAQNGTVDEELSVQATSNSPQPFWELQTSNGDASIDSGSGLFTWTPTAADVGDHNFTIEVTDTSSSLSDTETFTVSVSAGSVDVTPPTVTISTPADSATYMLDEVVLADYSCDDTESGIAVCLGDVPSGQTIDTSTAGPHLFHVTGTDNAGNERTVTHSYLVDVPTGPVIIVVTEVVAVSSRSVPMWSRRGRVPADVEVLIADFANS